VPDDGDPHRGRVTAQPSRIVIAGAGLAALRAAQAVRRAGFAGELVIVGDEPHPPYNRPPLSKELLAGTRQAADVAFPGVDAFDADWRLGVRATGLDAGARMLTTTAGELGYDRLIVATGSRARTLPGVAGGPEAGLHTLRGLDDAHALRDALTGGATRRLAIVGAGFVGCEVAATARGHGIAVTLIDLAPQPLVPLGPELGARVARMHAGHGVELRLGVGVERVRTGDDGHVTGVALADGSTVTADRVLIALGAVPNTEFLRGTSVALAADGGVVCDATLTSVSEPDVLAAGDVAAWPHPGAGGERVRVEHWTTAAEHGRVAGENAVAGPPERDAHLAPPYFWSDQYDCKIQSVGFPARAARIEIVEEDAAADPPRLVAEALGESGELAGAVTFNHARRLADLRRRLVVEFA
jgi:3-phenylpropionate/trans-cinnamate dioxygenase ferredoxin reductase component